MKKQFNRFLSWILFLWIRVEVLPEEDPRPLIDPAGPVLYVLADRGLSDLLVLNKITARFDLPDPLAKISIETGRQYHSIYSIASRSPLGDWIKGRRKHSAMLTDLMQVLAGNDSLEVQIVPVSVFWGRPLARHKHWFQALFADTWAFAGRTRKFFTILIHGRNTRLIFSPTLSMRDIISDNRNDAQSLQELLVTTLRRQREATFGPQITSHKLLTAQVIEDPSVEELIPGKNDGSRRDYSRAQRYCREIFADCTQLTIEIMLRLLRAFWRRYYSGIQIYNANRIRQAALTHQLVYVPCHRSHVDYLLLSYVIYNENLALPYIAAGNNLDIPFIGRILRGGGAFFIRRSFKDNPLYNAVIRAYVYQLVKLGVPMEYFIEGGRSRSGRMLKPKFGMLGMTVDAYIKSQARPMAFVPVYLGYEKLIEGKSYIGELYGGKKKRESTLGTLGAIFRLKGHFGKVTVSFGEPVQLNRLLEQHCSDWADRVGEIKQRPDWYRAGLQHLSREIMHGINRACVINSVNSIATILLATPRQSIEIKELVSQAKLHHRLIRGAPCLASIGIEGKVSKKQIGRLAERKIVHIRQTELGDIVYLKSEDSALIGYYRNNSLHSLIIPAFIACCFTNIRRVSNASIKHKIGLLYPFLESELQLEWQESELADVIDQFINCLVDASLLERVKNDLRRPQRHSRRFIQLIRLGHVVQPILERYYMAFVVLWQTSAAPLVEAELEHRCHLLAQKISMIYGINSPDFFDRLLFRDFINTALESGYLVKNDQLQLELKKGFNYASLDLRNLLSTEVRSSILSLIKTTPH